jgi:hypothetical protein
MSFDCCLIFRFFGGGVLGYRSSGLGIRFWSFNVLRNRDAHNYHRALWSEQVDNKVFSLFIELVLQLLALSFCFELWQALLSKMFQKLVSCKCSVSTW